MRFALVLALVINLPWTIAMAYFSLMAESGGKEPSLLAAGFAAWALAEIVATVVASTRGRAVSRSRMSLAWVLPVLLILRPLLDIAPLDLGSLLPRRDAWKAMGIAVSGLAIACARVLRMMMKRSTA